MERLEISPVSKSTSSRARRLAFELAGPFMRLSAITVPTAVLALDAQEANAQAQNCIVSVRPEGAPGQVIFTSRADASKSLSIPDFETRLLPEVRVDTSVNGRPASTWNVRHADNATSRNMALICNTGQENPNRVPLKIEPRPTLATLTPTAVPAPERRPSGTPTPSVPRNENDDNSNDNKAKPRWTQIPTHTPTTAEWIRHGTKDNFMPKNLPDGLTYAAVIGLGLLGVSWLWGRRETASKAISTTRNFVNPGSNPERRRTKAQEEVLKRQQARDIARQALSTTTAGQNLASAEAAVQAAENELAMRQRTFENLPQQKAIEAAELHIEQSNQKLAEPLPTGRWGKLLAKFTGDTLADRQQAVVNAQAELAAAKAALSATPEARAIRIAEQVLTNQKTALNTAKSALNTTSEYRTFQAAETAFQQAQQRAQIV